MAQLESLKIRLGISDTDKDDLLYLLLDDAKAEILDYTNREELTEAMEPLQRELAIVMYNRIGDEGSASRSEGGISVSYNGIPENIRERLNKYRRLKLAGIANANKE